ncbi:MAG: hypothetical protein ACMG6E_03660 [Candidatus Roizmanbacteria bacterium]
MFKIDHDKSDFEFGVSLDKYGLKNELSGDYKSPLSDQHHEFLNGKTSMISPVASRAASPDIKYASFDMYCEPVADPFHCYSEDYNNMNETED